MRIKTIVGLGFAGALVAVGVAGGAAYAADDPVDAGTTVKIIQDDCPAEGAPAREDL